MTDPTSTTTLQRLIPYLLPERGQQGSTLTAPTDLAAVLVHAIHTSLEFRLVRPSGSSSSAAHSAETEEQEQEQEEQQQRRADEDTEDTVSETETAVNAEDDSQATSSTSSPLDARFIRLATEARLSSGWNDRGEDSYTFTYKHEQSGLSFLVRVGRMGARVNVSGMAEDGEPRQTSTILNQLVDPAFLPWPRSDEPSSRDQGVQAGFVSDAKLKEFVDKYKKEVIAKLIPGLRIAGYTEPSGPDDRAPSSSGPRSNPYNHPRPDPSRGNRNDRDYNPYNPSVGHRDLDPLAGYQPPGIGMGFPGRPGAGSSGEIGGDGGGMLVDFDHPMFRGRRDDGRERGPGGMINPPGARWDPVGPGFPAGGGGGGGIGGGYGGTGGYGGMRGGRTPGEPDFDELLPPGENGPDLRQPGGRGGLGGPLGGPRGGGFGGGGMGGGFGGGGFGGGRGGGGEFGGGGGMFM